MLSQPPPRKFAVATTLVMVAVVAAGVWGFLQRSTSTTQVPAAVPVPTMTVDQLADAIVSGNAALVLDLRPAADFLASHVPNAVSLPAYQVLRSAERLEPFHSWRTVLVCADDDCAEVTQATRDLRLLGFTDLYQLEGGFAAYQAADLTLATQAKLVQDDLGEVLRGIEVPTITVAELQARLADVFVVDVRTPYEFVTGFIPGAIDLPLYATAAALEQGLYERARSRDIVVYDTSGNRSRIVAQALADAGYKVFSLEGGFEAWSASGADVALPAQDGSDVTDLIPILTLE